MSVTSFGDAGSPSTSTLTKSLPRFDVTSPENVTAREATGSMELKSVTPMLFHPLESTTIGVDVVVVVAR